MTRRIRPDRLRQARKNKHLTALALAKLIGVSEVAIRTWEGGRHSPTPENLEALAGALGVPVKWITSDYCPTCGQHVPNPTEKSTP